MSGSGDSDHRVQSYITGSVIPFVMTVLKHVVNTRRKRNITIIIIIIIIIITQFFFLIRCLIAYENLKTSTTTLIYNTNNITHKHTQDK